MNILLIANDTNYIYYLRRELITRFTQEGHKVILVGEILDYVEDLKKICTEIVNVNNNRHSKNPLNDIHLLIQYIKIIKKYNPDIVFTYNIKANVYAGIACQIQNKKYAPNICGLGTPLENGGMMQKISKALYKLGIRKAHTVFFQNEDNLLFFLHNNMLNKNSHYVVLPGSGVNLENYPLLNYPNSNEIHFLFAARIMKEKGIDIFLDIARKFSSPQIIFDVCGQCDDEKYKEIIKTEHEKGNIIYHGLQKDLKPFYKQCSCFLYPSYYPEGMSNVLLEAASSGRPVIATDRCGCREIVDNNISGFIVKKNDVVSTTDAVEKFLGLTTQERTNMGIAGRNKIAREFDRQIVVGKYIEVLNNIN